MQVTAEGNICGTLDVFISSGSNLAAWLDSEMLQIRRNMQYYCGKCVLISHLLPVAQRVDLLQPIAISVQMV